MNNSTISLSSPSSLSATSTTMSITGTSKTNVGGGAMTVVNGGKVDVNEEEKDGFKIKKNIRKRILSFE